MKSACLCGDKNINNIFIRNNKSSELLDKNSFYKFYTNTDYNKDGQISVFEKYIVTKENL